MEFFITINQWMVSGTWIAALGCFLWGIVSVLFSPCHLASIPLIVGYVGGQKKIVVGREASIYSAIFSIGLFTTIAIIGIICSLLGRMLGDIGQYWTIVVGLVLVWVAMGMLGVSKCTISGGAISKVSVKGKSGALVLGLLYGVLSGSCTFGFIAPILAVITIQKQFVTGVALIICFGIGHCLPILIAGISVSFVRNLMDNMAWHNGSHVFRKLASVLILCLGLYFVSRPFITI